MSAEPQYPAKRSTSELDVRHVGLGFAVVAALICVLAFGLAPTALAIGLLALLVVD